MFYNTTCASCLVRISGRRVYTPFFQLTGSPSAIVYDFANFSLICVCVTLGQIKKSTGDHPQLSGGKNRKSVLFFKIWEKLRNRTLFVCDNTCQIICSSLADAILLLIDISIVYAFNYIYLKVTYFQKNSSNQIIFLPLWLTFLNVEGF